MGCSNSVRATEPAAQAMEHREKICSSPVRAEMEKRVRVEEMSDDETKTDARNDIDEEDELRKLFAARHPHQNCDIKLLKISLVIHLNLVGDVLGRLERCWGDLDTKRAAELVRDKLDEVELINSFKQVGGLASCCDMLPPSNCLAVEWDRKVSVSFYLAVNIMAAGLNNYVPTWISSHIGQMQWIIKKHAMPIVKRQVVDVVKHEHADLVIVRTEVVVVEKADVTHGGSNNGKVRELQSLHPMFTVKH